MLVVYTHTDADSNLTKSFALTFVESGRKLVSQILKPRTSSNAASVRNWLQSNATKPLLFFGHGIEDQNRNPPYYLEGQDGNSVLDETDGTLVQDRLVVAICCYGIDALDGTTKTTTYNATVLGHRGPMELAHERPTSSSSRIASWPA